MVLEFGEFIQLIPFKNESRTDKVDATLREGVWLGFDSRTDGIQLRTSMRKMPREFRI